MFGCFPFSHRCHNDPNERIKKERKKSIERNLFDCNVMRMLSESMTHIRAAREQEEQNNRKLFLDKYQSHKPYIDVFFDGVFFSFKRES